MYCYLKPIAMINISVVLVSNPPLCVCLKEQVKFLEEELRCMEESELSFSAYTNWYGATSKNFKNVITKFDVVDKTTMEKKVQKLEVKFS